MTESLQRSTKQSVLKDVLGVEGGKGDTYIGSPIKKHNIVHLITSLQMGGANMMLYKLLCMTNKELFDSAVIVLEEKGLLGEKIESLGLPVYSIGMRRDGSLASSAIRLHKLIRKIQPDVIQAWTYHSNVIASLLSVVTPNAPVVWNIRHTPYDLKNYGKLTYLVIRYGAWLSRQPVRTIYNSHLSLEKHRGLGYYSQRSIVIPNGFDTDVFKPSIAAYKNLRSSINAPRDAFVVGMVNRYHPMKDHASFLQAASRLHQKYPNVNFVLVGRGMDRSNTELVRQIQMLNLSDKVFLFGERTEIQDVTAGFDVASMTSAWGDAFPNVVGEAMACEVPCVVTDIGDAAQMVADTGIVVPPRDPDALFRAWEAFIKMDVNKRHELGRLARERINSNYSLPKIVRSYEAVYREVTCRLDSTGN